MQGPNSSNVVQSCAAIYVTHSACVGPAVRRPPRARGVAAAPPLALCPAPPVRPAAAPPLALCPAPPVRAAVAPSGGRGGVTAYQKQERQKRGRKGGMIERRKKGGDK